MSGGSLDYIYSKLEYATDQICIKSRDYRHEAFVNHLRKVSKALKDLEWVLSGDMSPGDEFGSIEAVLQPGDELRAAIDQAERASKDLRYALNKAKGL